jgi:hypothetical protein
MLVLTKEELERLEDLYTEYHWSGTKMKPNLLQLARAIVEANDRKLGGITVTKNSHGQIVAVTRNDDEGRIVSVIAESTVDGLPKTRKDNWPFGASVGDADEALL